MTEQHTTEYFVTMKNLHTSFIYKLLASLCSLLVLVSCAKDPITGTSISTKSGSMSASIDGIGWQAFQSVQATYSNGELSIAGLDNTSRFISFTVFSSSGTISTATISSDFPRNSARLREGSQQFVANAVLGSGSVTFTTLTANQAEGTFQFVVREADSGRTQKTISSGIFSVQY